MSSRRAVSASPARAAAGTHLLRCKTNYKVRMAANMRRMERGSGDALVSSPLPLTGDLLAILLLSRAT
jgi:hypothetical protein